MPTLQFMPWCRIDKTYKAGKIEIIPFQRDSKIKGIDRLSSSYAKRILSSYKGIEGHGVENAALIIFKGKRLLADLTKDATSESSEEIEIFCFSGLANREYFRGSNYCNSENFSIYGHRFRDEPDHLALQARRAMGRQLDGGRTLSEVVFSIPVHCAGINEIALDKKLLNKLFQLKRLKPTEWGRWYNSISSFNLANTDNSLFREQVEWVLLASAFEHLLDAKPKDKDVARRFKDAFVPHDTIQVQETKRKSPTWRKPDEALRYEWMREFYGVRGSFAHGKLKPRKTMAWSPIEHLALARIAFPLLVRILLDKGPGRPKLPDDYKDEVNIFESLADEDFLKYPSGARNSNDTHWSRLLSSAGRNARRIRMARALRENLASV